MKSYLLPFTTTTTGTWEIHAESLEDVKKIIGMGWPYEHAQYEEVVDVNTVWDIDAVVVKEEQPDLVFRDYIIEASQRRYLSVTVQAVSYEEAELIAEELLTEDFKLDSTDFSIDNIYSKIEED
jgi:hypothetical protein